MIGRFKNAGVAWNQEPVPVKDHDFPSEADGKAIPYGIYDLKATLGTIIVGTTRETAQIAVDSIEMWWLNERRHRYLNARELLILADGGGANGATNRAWKHGLYHQLGLEALDFRRSFPILLAAALLFGQALVDRACCAGMAGADKQEWCFPVSQVSFPAHAWPLRHA